MATKVEATTAAPQSAMTFAPGPKNAQRLSGAIDQRIANTLREIVDASESVTNSRVYPSKDDKQFRLDRNFMRKHLAATFDNRMEPDGTPTLRYVNPEGDIVDAATADAQGAFLVDEDGTTLNVGWTQVPHTATHRVKISYYGKPDAVEFSLSIATRRTRSNGDDDESEDDAAE